MKIVCKGTINYCRIIVRKFYANVPNVIVNKVKVWDVLAPFSPSNIKSHYSLMDVAKDEYENYLQNMEYIDVIVTLPMERAEWEITNRKPRGFEEMFN